MLEKLLLVLKFLPYVVAAVKEVEEVVGAGNGKAKKDLIMESISAVVAVGTQVDNTTVSALSALTDGVVKSLNSSGVFKTKETK